MPSGISVSGGGGGGAYGRVPSATPIPPSIYEQIQSSDPGLTNLSGGANAVTGGQLAGQLSPETINAIKNQSASFGVSSGVPGSQFQGHQGLATLGLNVENIQNQGLQNYLGSLRTMGSLQLDPSVIASVNMRNADLAAAPDPAMAAQALEDLYQKHWTQNQKETERYLAMNGPAGGTGFHGTLPGGGGLSSGFGKPAFRGPVLGPEIPYSGNQGGFGGGGHSFDTMLSSNSAPYGSDFAVSPYQGPGNFYAGPNDQAAADAAYTNQNDPYGVAYDTGLNY